ncbi:hypothetical protein KRR55_19770 [Paeniglutamicibacter sp. ABSL32-1]|uniref:hypothetical protein n=1 Tax=Paeniglutamicibacter quisquiliarum TaxID=2849498 RepID=UPI001C2DD0CC|nr:hypothetical protein [Paeniglutamicibacter quisquiliarum]MBV1781346.1 hypothetical protein [Paeniglutamicibacter quisquiliarum]
METLNVESDDVLKRLLHEAFDTQIPNFGSYNLVAAAGSSGSAGLKVIGFRREPAELILCPLNPADLCPTERAVSVNNTNVSHVALVLDGGYEVGTSTGRVYRFNVPGRLSLNVPSADENTPSTSGILLQEDDAQEFADFMNEFMDRLDPTIKP